MSILRGTTTTKCAHVAPSLRVMTRTRVCCVASLAKIDIFAALRSLHPSCSGHNALRVGLIQRFLGSADSEGNGIHAARWAAARSRGGEPL